jgi:hypothetical protein
MPAPIAQTARAPRAVPPIGKVSCENRFRNSDRGIPAAEDEELPTAANLPRQAKGAMSPDDGVVDAVFGWLLAALIMVPLLTIATLPVTTTAIVLITGLALFVTAPLSYYLAKQSTAVRLVGLGIYVVVDVTLTVVGLLLELLSAFG